MLQSFFRSIISSSFSLDLHSEGVFSTEKGRKKIRVTLKSHQLFAKITLYLQKQFRIIYYIPSANQINFPYSLHDAKGIG